MAANFSEANMYCNTCVSEHITCLFAHVCHMYRDHVCVMHVFINVFKMCLYIVHMCVHVHVCVGAHVCINWVHALTI